MVADVRTSSRTLYTCLVAWLVGACANGAPHATERESHIKPSGAIVAPSGSDSLAGAGAGAGAAQQASAGSVAAPTGSAPLPENSARSGPTTENDALTELPPLADSSGRPLPQTDELPPLDSPRFQRRLELLFAAIVADTPDLAKNAFFPLLAYEQVKAIERPARDWQYRLFAAFRRDVHEYHQQLGNEPSRARLLGLDHAGQQARWMKPGTEGNRLGYYRLLRTRLRVVDGNGRERRLEITSMISWRGEWYVVHLHGFK